MPDFGGIQRGRSITGAGTGSKISPGVGTQLGQAIKSVGRGLGDIAAVAERNKIQDRSNKLGILKKSYDDLRRPYFTEESNLTGSDTYGNVERVDENSKKWLTELTKDIDDPELVAGLNAYSDVETGNMKDRLAQYQATQRGEVNRQVREESLDGILRDSRDGFDLLSNSIDKIRDVAADQRELGMMGEEEAVDFIVSSQQAIAEAHLEGIMDRNPERAIKLIEKGVYEDYLSPKQIKAADKKAKTMQNALDADAKAAKVEAERLAKVQKEEQRQEANKGLTDLYSVETLTRTAIEDLRDKLSSTDYQTWIDRQKKSVENKSKATGKTVENQTTITKFEVEAGKMSPTTTDGQLQDLQIRLYDQVELENMEGKTAERILGTAANSRNIGPVRKAEEEGAVAILKADFDGGVLDHLTLREQQTVENYMLQWGRENPDKPFTEVLTKIVEPFEEQRIVDWFGAAEVIDPIRFIREAKFDPEEIAARIPESDVAIQILNDVGQPVTEANIKYILKQRGVNAGD